MEWNDIYNADRVLTGRRHLRGTPWRDGELGLVVCVWVYDGRGNVLLTRRAPEKSFAGTWENSGGAAKAGESSPQAIVRELFEETGIRAEAEEFELLATTRDKNMFYDHYCLCRQTPLEEVVLLPGETDAACWATFDQVREMIHTGKMCAVIGEQFLQLEPELAKRQTAQA
jgi:mutator protein MutT